MTKTIYKKKQASEICRRLEGLGFSCKIELIMRTLIRLHGRKYKIKTNAPEIVAKDIIYEAI